MHTIISWTTWAHLARGADRIVVQGSFLQQRILLSQLLLQHLDLPARLRLSLKAALRGSCACAELHTCPHTHAWCNKDRLASPVQTCRQRPGACPPAQQYHSARWRGSGAAARSQPAGSPAAQWTGRPCHGHWGGHGSLPDPPGSRGTARSAGEQPPAAATPAWPVPPPPELFTGTPNVSTQAHAPFLRLAGIHEHQAAGLDSSRRST